MANFLAPLVIPPHLTSSCCVKEVMKLGKANFSVGNGQNIEMSSDLVWGLLLSAVQLTPRVLHEQWKADSKQLIPE